MSEEKHVDVDGMEEENAKMDDDVKSESGRQRRSAAVNNKSWSALMNSGKRDDEEVDEADLQPEDYRPPVVHRIPAQGPRKRGRPRKNPLPEGMAPVLSAAAAAPPPTKKPAQRYTGGFRMGDITSDDGEVEEEDDDDMMGGSGGGGGAMRTPAGRGRPRGRGAASASQRGRGAMAGGAGRYVQSAPRLVAGGSASALAAARLPLLSGAGGTPTGKPLNVVKLVGNSMRGRIIGPPSVGARGVAAINAGRMGGLGGGGANPGGVVSRMPIGQVDRQASAALEAAQARTANRVVAGQAVADFNRLAEYMQAEIARLQEDSRKQASNHREFCDQTALAHATAIDLKDSRIRQLEQHVERLQNQLSSIMKAYHTQLLDNDAKTEEGGEKSGGGGGDDKKDCEDGVGDDDDDDGQSKPSPLQPQQTLGGGGGGQGGGDGGQGQHRGGGGHMAQSSQVVVSQASSQSHSHVHHQPPQQQQQQSVHHAQHVQHQWVDQHGRVVSGRMVTSEEGGRVMYVDPGDVDLEEEMIEMVEEEDDMTAAEHHMMQQQMHQQQQQRMMDDRHDLD